MLSPLKAVMIAHTPMPQPQLEQAAAQLGRMNQIWDDIELTMSRLGQQPTLAEAAQEARAGYETRSAPSTPWWTPDARAAPIR